MEWAGKGLRSAAVRPNRYVFPGRSQRRRPAYRISQCKRSYEYWLSPSKASPFSKSHMTYPDGWSIPWRDEWIAKMLWGTCTRQAQNARSRAWALSDPRFGPARVSQHHLGLTLGRYVDSRIFPQFHFPNSSCFPLVGLPIYLLNRGQRWASKIH